MLYLSEIISKPILNIYSGKIEGIISDAIMDKTLKKITKFKLFDEDEEEYYLETQKIYSMGKNMCVIKNSEPLNLVLTQSFLENNPINKKIYSTTGEEIGRITDVEVNEKFEITLLKTEKLSIKPNNILNISENIIVNLENKKIKLNSLKPKIPQKRPKNIVSILPKIEEINENTFLKKEPYKINPNLTPTKVSSNVQFLLGRKVSKTIYGINNEIIIKKDSLINSKNLESAKKHSKLAELTLYSNL